MCHERSTVISLNTRRVSYRLAIFCRPFSLLLSWDFLSVQEVFHFCFRQSSENYRFKHDWLINYSEPTRSHDHTHWFHPMNQGLQKMSGCGRSNHGRKTINNNIIAVITAADIKSHDGSGVSGPPLIFSCRPGFSNVEQTLKHFKSFTQRLSPLQNKNIKGIPAVRVTVIIGNFV